MGESSEGAIPRPDLKIIPGGKPKPKEISRIWEHMPNHPSNPYRDTVGNIIPIKRSELDTTDE